nr:histidinol-phosphatase HisJ family protein [Bacilli bacterium]
MLRIDQHVHSSLSHDGISNMREHMVHARNYGISEFTFTEHYDDYTGVNTDIKELDINRYREEYLKNKDDSFVKTNFGIEIGLRPESYNKISTLVKENKFDFIIGSSHITCGKDMSRDETFFEGLTPHDAVLRYLNEVLENVKIYKDEFDVYGHIDYVIRYVIGNYGKAMTKIDYNEFREILDEILLSIIKKDKGIEINTSGVRYGLGTPHPNIGILKRYHELGGKIITIGSDAHKATQLINDFNIAYSMLEEAGFNEIAVYHGRKPDFVKVKGTRH